MLDYYDELIDEIYRNDIKDLKKCFRNEIYKEEQKFTTLLRQLWMRIVKKK